eukprot:Awhi_evm1s5628
MYLFLFSSKDCKICGPNEHKLADCTQTKDTHCQVIQSVNCSESGSFDFSISSEDGILRRVGDIEKIGECTGLIEDGILRRVGDIEKIGECTGLINLAHKDIQYIHDDCFSGWNLGNEVSIDLSDNNITSLPYHAFYESQFKLLKLDNNPITYLETGIFDSLFVETISFEDMGALQGFDS